MIITKRLTKSSAERLYVVALNTTGGAVSAGYNVCWANGLNASAKGYEIEKPHTSALSLYAGVVEDDMAASDFGLVQVWGYNEKAYLRFESNQGANGVQPGQHFGPVAGQWYVASNGRSYAMGPVINMSEFAANTHEAAGRVFIRAL